MKYFTFLFIGFFLNSCSNEDAPENTMQKDPLILEMTPYLFYSGFWPNTEESNSNFNFEYEYDANQRLSKVLGGFLYTANPFFNNLFTKKVYTSLHYNNNSVTVENYITSTDITVAKETKIFTLNSSNQILTKEIPNPIFSNNRRDEKQSFKYTNNRLTEIVTTYPNDPDSHYWTTSEHFYYGTNGNLTKTEYFELDDQGNSETMIIRTFEDYDTATNPCKRLQLVDALFYRSLSNNNFRKYTEVRYSYNSLIAKSENIRIFPYDQNGQLRLK